MSITATELKKNLGYYLALASTETISITKNGRVVAPLSNPKEIKEKTVGSLRGILPNDSNVTMDTFRMERLEKQLSN
ncbi:MAG: type II toxin-antitoxin system Phd/YefM family antitoxin [Sphaerochaetaceae bacterium]|nr:type II toxin-antitoxin system Phd/YefM family antitoxin [Sphaerochaetaceae bacterium]